MSTLPTRLAGHIQIFLGDHLAGRRNLSPHTVRAYRDAFTLLLRFCRDRKGFPPERLQVQDLDADLILEFLEKVGEDRKWSPSTRNHRLAALHSFFRFLQVEAPEHLHQCQRVLAIPVQRTRRFPVTYLAVEELTELLRRPDQSEPMGRRDDVLLILLYDTGARVQEVLDLTPRDLRLDTPAQVRLTGKGRKTRVVPLMASTVQKLRSYLDEHDMLSPARDTEPLFRGRLGSRLTRSGVRYILAKYVAQATEHRLPARCSPHTLRHSKAMHLLQAGVPLVVIRNILGHEDVQTTEVYARADLSMKRQALERVASPAGTSRPREEASWRRDPDLLAWLQSL